MLDGGTDDERNRDNSSNRWSDPRSRYRRTPLKWRKSVRCFETAKLASQLEMSRARRARFSCLPASSSSWYSPGWLSGVRPSFRYLRSARIWVSKRRITSRRGSSRAGYGANLHQMISSASSRRIFEFVLRVFFQEKKTLLSPCVHVRLTWRAQT